MLEVLHDPTRPPAVSAESKPKSGVDLNDMEAGETWWGNKFANAPNSSTAYMLVIRVAGGQFAVVRTGATGAPKAWVRLRVNNVWSDWAQLA